LLIKDWRNQWGRNDIPFYFCQLANYGDKPKSAGEEGRGFPVVREAQLLALTLPCTGMAVLIDTGESEDIHPNSKDVAGVRLAKIALSNTYGKSIPYSGPIYKSMNVEGSKIRIHFRYLEGGLVAKEVPETYAVMLNRNTTAPFVRNSPDSELEGFAICGDDKNWVWADAKIDPSTSSGQAGKTVLVWSDKVPAPVAVRYAWAENPTGNLYNKAGLPASPFRTDDYHVKTEQDRIQSQ
jgi:sialate O-acetylesterase